MSGLRVSSLRGETNGSSPTFPDGVVVSGVVTSTTFSGNLTGNVTGNISGTTGSFSGDVSIGGTLTYDDVTNIDSVGVITARSGIKVGAGQSISAISGTLTYYGDGSNLSGVTAGGEADFVASGTIPNGATVILKEDGKVGIITQTGSSDPSSGTPVIYESNSTYGQSAVYDSNAGKVVIAYRKNDGSNTGQAIVGTVSGTSISFGTPVEFESGGSALNISLVYDPVNQKVVLIYEDDTNSDYGTALVGTVSGTSITFGTPVIFESAAVNYCDAAYDSTNGKVVIAYRDDGNGSNGTAIVGGVSGNTITFGSPVVFNTGTNNYIRITDVSNGKVVIVYRDYNNSSYATAIVGTVNGSAITFGSSVVYASAAISYMDITYDSTNDKVVIGYKDTGNSNYGTAIVGTVSGTSISFGTPVVFSDNRAIQRVSATFDSNNNKVVVAYEDKDNLDYGTVVVGTVSGTSISFSTPLVFESADSDYFATTYDSTNDKVVVSYMDRGGSMYGTAVVIDTNSLVTNLTTENYIGIAAETISDGQTGKINIIGGVNSGQTGLTTAQTYYVQNSGGIGLNASIPSVVAGTSISDTEILVR